MRYLLHGEKVATTAGDYSIIWYVDQDPESPYDEGFTLLTRGNRSQIDIHVGDTDSAESRQVQRKIDGAEVSGAAIVRYLRLAGKRGVTLVDTAYRPVTATADRDDVAYGVAWVDDDFTDPEMSVRVLLRQWQAWADGDVFGYVVEDPSGEEIDSCWGFYGFNAEFDYTRGEASAAINADTERRCASVGLVGAGIVGII